MKHDKHIVSIEQFGLDNIIKVFKTAEGFLKCDPRDVIRSAVKEKILKDGPVMTGLFYEPSTRTSLSFQTAASTLGFQVFNPDLSVSAEVKGEDFSDTIKTVEALGASVIVLRHSSNGAAELAAKLLKEGCSLINGGDGTNAHPTQAMIDALTIIIAIHYLGATNHEPCHLKHDKPRFGLSGVKVAICGDLLRSRAAHSQIALLKMLDADLRLVTKQEKAAQLFGLPVEKDLTEELCKDLDAVIMSRNQKERASGDDEASGSAKQIQLTSKMAEANPKMLILHPGPVMWGQEIEANVANKESCLVTNQVSIGISVRMACLLWCLGKC